MTTEQIPTTAEFGMHGVASLTRPTSDDTPKARRPSPGDSPKES